MEQTNVKAVAQKIRGNYEEQGESKLNELKKLDRKARLASEIFTYVFGIIGALMLGIGMCLAMKIIGDLMPLGIVIGCIGIGMVSVNYMLYRKIQNHTKKKYAAQILQLSGELLGE